MYIYTYIHVNLEANASISISIPDPWRLSTHSPSKPESSCLNLQEGYSSRSTLNSQSLLWTYKRWGSQGFPVLVLCWIQAIVSLVFEVCWEPYGIPRERGHV